MMIDPEKEELISLSHGAVIAEVSLGSVNRWWQTGVLPADKSDRIKLETIKRAGRRKTSREALVRFFAATAAADSAPPTMNADQHRAQSERADALLSAAGV